MAEFIRPERMDVVIDTDAYNEIDDQFAISYALKNADRLNVLALYAAPFHNARSVGPEDGMVKSYDEILKLLELAEREDLKPVTYEGSRAYLTDEATPVDSPAARDLVARAKAYSPEHPLYVVALGAITNVASALILDPSIGKNLVISWLGGHAQHWHDTAEFNMMQDVAAARVVFDSDAELIQLPCHGVVSEFRTTGPELVYWLCGRNPLADYLARNVIEEAESYAKGKAWSRVIWDVTAVAYLLNDGDCFMRDREMLRPVPEYDNSYSYPQENRKPFRYVYGVDRDALMTDLFQKLI